MVSVRGILVLRWEHGVSRKAVGISEIQRGVKGGGERQYGGHRRQSCCLRLTDRAQHGRTQQREEAGQTNPGQAKHQKGPPVTPACDPAEKQRLVPGLAIPVSQRWRMPKG